MTITINPAAFWFIIGVVSTIAFEIAVGMIINNKEKKRRKSR